MKRASLKNVADHRQYRNILSLNFTKKHRGNRISIPYIHLCTLIWQRNRKLQLPMYIDLAKKQKVTTATVLI